jgi:regulator of sigma E protease
LDATLNAAGLLSALDLGGLLTNIGLGLKVLIGFSIIIFVHELGHFLAAKWVGIRVDRFAIGFGYRLFGWRRGEGLTFGRRPEYTADQLAEKSYGETDYCFNVLPLGGYVRMLGQEDIVIDDKTGEVQLSGDPRAFTSRPVGHRMIVASAGVIFNLIFAALLFMVVFLAGQNMIAPVAGAIFPGSPADVAGLRPGDRVLEVNGSRVQSFVELAEEEMLGLDQLVLKVERDGRVLDRPVVLDLPAGRDTRIRASGIDPPQTTTLERDCEPLGDLPAPKKGDRITSVNGQPVRTGAEVHRAFEASDGRVLKLTVERPDPTSKNAPPQALEVYQRPMLAVFPVVREGLSPYQRPDEATILGMRQRRRVLDVIKGGPAEAAGFKVGDVIAQWDNIANPLHAEIIANIRANPGRALPVTVIRAGKPVQLSVTPRRSGGLLSSGDARVELGVSGVEEDLPVVADVAPGTPAAVLNLPRGAVLLTIDDQPVQNWFDVVRLLRERAGREIAVRYRSGNDEAAGRMTVPSSIVSEIGLSPAELVLSIDGQKEFPPGSGRELPAEAVLRAALAANVGKTVTVQIVDVATGATREAPFNVRPDNIDPWQIRIQFAFAGTLGLLQERVDAGGNPFRAVAMGVNFTIKQVAKVFSVMRGMAARRVNFENVAGPVGIVSVAVEQARVSFTDLLFFLGFLSANLAVINFLPLPVMDGGLMVFLLIEKIKGKPLSLKTQMISTLVGLAVIVLCFLLVTFQDISRLVSS